jgi:long-chain fatty acid transport protein
MNSETNALRALLILGILTVWQCSAGAVGFRLPNQDPEAISRGNAFAATADNASAIYCNPAGITQLEGHNLRAGIYMVSPGIKYRSPSGAEARAKSDFKPVPQFYYVFSPKDCLFSFGLGMYAPYGLALDWGHNTPFRTLGEKGELLYLTFNPVVALEIHPTLSLGAGPTINYSDAKFSRGIGFMPTDQFIMEGDGMDYGFNAGLLWRPHPQWAFGLNYRYVTTVDYDGTSRTVPSPPYPGPTAASASITFPQFVVAGVSFKPSEKWNIEFNVDWTDWDNVNQIGFEGTSFGTQVLPLNYRSSLMYQLGITRKLHNGYFVSTGYFFSENSSPDRHFTPIIPDSDLHLGSIGFGRRGARWDWAVAYHFGYNAGRTVRDNQSASPIGETADGTYRILNHAFNLAVGFKF